MFAFFYNITDWVFGGRMIEMGGVGFYPFCLGLVSYKLWACSAMVWDGRIRWVGDF